MTENEGRITRRRQEWLEVYIVRHRGETELIDGLEGIGVGMTEKASEARGASGASWRWDRLEERREKREAEIRPETRGGR